ncbi:TetR/AcrR family transcriptional regulator [Litoreibacter albidus]|uniref:TetR/AcrR family transcriptional regulator n=1 Tax=Litoreibacter albidus TaxID=670155 RepID=UPI003735CA78
MNGKKRTPRGRPQKLRRDRVINVAMESYWANGPENVSVNEICKLAEVSKPSLYREFGSEDGLQEAVLVTYCDTALSQLYAVLRSDQPFYASVDAVTSLFLTARAEFPTPRGCLLRDMSDCLDQLGDQTQKTVAVKLQDGRSQYASWIKRAIERGEATTSVPIDVAATYIDLQIGNAMTLNKQSAPDGVIQDVMQLSFSVFRGS